MSARLVLRKLMDQVAKAGSLQDVYDGALACLHETLDVERASVLVLDKNKVMRFVAWTGLSEAYRAAVDGHSPWDADDPKAESVVVSDISDAPEFANFRPVFDKEGIAAAAFIPLRFGRKLLGKFMLYYDRPHDFTDDELGVAETIAGHIAFAMEHHRMARQLEARLRVEHSLLAKAEQDVAERKRLEHSKEFLAEASRILATTLQPEETIKQLAHLVVPQLADWCIIQVVDEQGQIKPVELAHSDPGKVELGWQLASRWPGASADGSAVTAVRTGESTLVAHIEPHMLASRAAGDEHLEALKSLGLTSAITVPLKARGRKLGALTLLTAESKRVYDTTDVRFAEDIAGWAALAIDNAQLNREAQNARQVAERSQEFLQILARVSDDLASLLDPDAALKQLASRLVGSLADYCITYSCDGATIRRLGLAHRETTKRSQVEALCEAGPPTLDDKWGAGAVIRTGEAILVSHISANLLQESAQNERHLASVQALSPSSAIIVPLRARGRTLGAIALVTDETSKRRYDEDDLKLARELASRAALLVDNARLYSQARAAIRARDDMIAVVSHDLRSPLQSISSAATLLEFETQAGSAGRSLEAINLATAQMDRLLQDLLDLSLIDAGQLTVTKELMDAATLIDEAHTMFEPLAGDKSVRLECHVEPSLPRIRIDRNRMQQVLANLLGNALKFVPAGGKIELNACREKGFVRISVSDTGPGIGEADLRRVFDRFWRADRRKERGIGLGLTVAQGIVQAHGGQIRVESRKGEGSTFIILLDAVAPLRREANAARPKPARQKDGPVLVVDDDEPFRTEIVEALQHSGYAVVSAGDGREALEYLRGDNTPALVLLDMMMPLMEGWSLLEAVKHDPRLASVPVVLLTCLGDNQSDVPRQDVSGYLNKPVRMKKLLSIAAQHCRGSNGNLSGFA